MSDKLNFNTLDLMFFIGIFFAQLLILYFLSKKLFSEISRFIYRLTNSKKLAVYLIAVMFLPGTIFHEVSHFLMALFLLVPVGQVEFLPEIQDSESVKMGSVAIGKTDPIRRFLVGIAPFITGTSIIIAGLYYLSINNLLQNRYYILLTAYFVFSIGNTMFASKEDLRGAGELFIFMLFLYILITIFKIDLPLVNWQAVLSDEVTMLIKTANLLLTVPLALDITVIFMLKFLRFRIRA